MRRRINRRTRRPRFARTRVRRPVLHPRFARRKKEPAEEVLIDFLGWLEEENVSYLANDMVKGLVEGGAVGDKFALIRYMNRLGELPGDLQDTADRFAAQLSYWLQGKSY